MRGMRKFAVFVLSIVLLLNMSLLGQFLGLPKAKAADTIPPTGSVIINSGDAHTYSSTVTLTLSASDADSGVSAMMISNNSGFSGAVEESYSTSKEWNLASGDGVKTVYVKYKDGAGNWSNDPYNLDWIQTSLLDFEAGTKTNVDTSASPNDVKLSLESGFVLNSETYLYRRQLTVNNNDGSILSSGYSAQLSLSDAAAAAVYNKSLISGDDVRIAYWDGSFTELDRDVVAFSSSAINIWFKTQSDIAASSSSTSYYTLLWRFRSQ